MGMVQLEVLKRILADRFSIDVEFEFGANVVPDGEEEEGNENEDSTKGSTTR